MIDLRQLVKVAGILLAITGAVLVVGGAVRWLLHVYQTGPVSKQVFWTIAFGALAIPVGYMATLELPDHW